MPWRLLASIALLFCTAAQGATLLVLRFHNNSQYRDLDWVGESVSETLRSELGSTNQIVLDRDSRAEGMRRLSLRPDVEFTKATLIRLGQTLDADFICYGSYEADLPAGDTQLKDSSVRLTANFLDLRKMHEGPDISEAGKLSELSRLEEHLAWESLKYVDPKTTLQLDQFLSPQKLIRLDAEESYVRGLLSSSPEQQQKWFTQAAALDTHFTSPVFELGRLALEHKEYRQATTWFERIPPGDARFAEARFKLGLSAYGAGDYSASANYFRELVKTYPLGEVYNDLGAAESQLDLPAALDDYRRALEGDPNDSVYLFNLGAALWKNSYYDEAVTRLQAAADRMPDDSDAQLLLERARRHDPATADVKSSAAPRLKENFDETAFRQLKAMLQPKGSE